MAGVLIEDEEEEKLRNLGVKDSKMLTPAQRKSLYPKIIKMVKDYAILIIPPQEIDIYVQGKDGQNLNFLEANKSIEIINRVKPDVAYLDSPSNNLRAYKEYVQNLLSVPCKIIAAHKADVKYPVVSAASILAKVTRDREIEIIQQNIPEPIGSGYMTDPITVKFIQEHYQNYPAIFRKSWEPYKKLLEGKKQQKLGEFE